MKKILFVISLLFATSNIFAQQLADSLAQQKGLIKIQPTEYNHFDKDTVYFFSMDDRISLGDDTTYSFMAYLYDKNGNTIGQRQVPGNNSIDPVTLSGYTVGQLIGIKKQQIIDKYQLTEIPY